MTAATVVRELTLLASASRSHVAACTSKAHPDDKELCGWQVTSATEAGAQMLGESHLREHGIRGHRVTVR